MELKKIFFVLHSGFNVFSLKIALKIANIDRIIETINTYPSSLIKFVTSDISEEFKLSYRLEELELLPRARSLLINAGINSIPEFIKKSEDELLKIRGFGKKSMNKAIVRLKTLGYKL